MSDYISREELLDRLEQLPKALELDYNNPFEDGVRIGIERAMMETEHFPTSDVSPGRDFRDCRNELCLLCGRYHERHLGACDGCRWEEY